jgi:hypothetical protein
MFWSRYLKAESIVYKRFDGDMGVKFTNRCHPPSWNSQKDPLLEKVKQYRVSNLVKLALL